MRFSIIVASLLFLTSVAQAFTVPTLPPRGITDVGNGGDLAICKDDQGNITNVELFDLMEGRTEQNIKSYVWPQGGDEYEIAQKVLNRFQQISIHRYKKLTEWLNEFESEITLTKNLYDVQDTEEWFLEDGCELVQLAIQEKPATPFETWYRIEEKLWMGLDIQNRAALILHEILYREAIQEYGHNNSRSIRKVNALLFADLFKTITDEQVYQTLINLHFPEYEFGRVLFEIDPVHQFQPTFDSNGKIQTVPCTVKNEMSSCEGAWESPLEPIFGFTDDHYVEGKSELLPMKDDINYAIHLGQTGIAKNVAYLDQVESPIKLFGHFFRYRLNPAEAHFLEYDDSGRISRIKGVVSIGDKNGGLKFKISVEDEWRKRMDVKFFYPNGSTFIGLAGGTLVRNGTSESLCGFPPDYKGNFEIGDYPSLLLVTDKKIEVVKECKGSPYSLGQIAFEEEGDLDFSKVPVSGAKTMTFTIKNEGEGDVSRINAFMSGAFQFAGGSFPGIGGTCSTKLVGQSRCDISITFKPTAQGAYSSSLILNYFDGKQTKTLSKNLKGMSASPTVLTISEIDPFDFGQVPIGSSRFHVFTLTNTGTLSAINIQEVGLAAPFGFQGGQFPGVLLGTCRKNLPPNRSCDIVVEFSPAASGLAVDTIDIEYGDGSGGRVHVTRQITGTGVVPANLSITEADPYDYGTVTQHAGATHTFTLVNSGGSKATKISDPGSLTAPFGYLGGSFPGTGGTCGSWLSPGHSCDIVVEYTPTSVGNAYDTINIGYYDGGAPQTVSRDVVGTGASPALLTLSEGPTYDFGLVGVGGSVEHIFSISNSGASPATGIEELGLMPPFKMKWTPWSDCGSTLAPGTTCSIVVVYEPTSLGVDNDTIYMSYHDGATHQAVTRDVSGTAGSPALLNISNGPTYDYGIQAVGSSTYYSFTVVNSGAVTAKKIKGNIVGHGFHFVGGTFPGTGGNCGAHLSAKSSCDIVVTFEPTFNGIVEAEINLRFDDGGGFVNSKRGLRGVGSSPANLVISGVDPVSFGTVAEGGASSVRLTVTNTGGVAATAVQEVGLKAPFLFSGGSYPGTMGSCDVKIQPGQSCDIELEFYPSAAAVYSDTIVLSYFNGAAVVDSSRDVQGSGVAPASLSISAANPYDFGTIAFGSTKTVNLTVVNTGGYTATGIITDGLGYPYGFVGGSYPGTGGTCGTTLVPAGHCTLAIHYTPANPSPGDHDALEIQYNDGAAAQVLTFKFVGKTVMGAKLKFGMGSSLSFGTVVTAGVAEKEILVSNQGGYRASHINGVGLRAPFSFKGGSYPGTKGTCGTGLSAGSSCTLVIEYSPTVPSKGDSDTLRLQYEDGVTSVSEELDVTGNAVPPASLTISQSDPYNFGIVEIGSSETRSFTVINSGGIVATSLNEIGLSAPFGFAGGFYPGVGGDCGTSLNAASHCTIVVEFQPTGPGTVYDTIEILFNNGVVTQSVTRNLQGMGVNHVVNLDQPSGISSNK